MEFTGERYLECDATKEQPIEREHWQRYLMAAQLVKSGDVVLDIACGAGYGSDYLAKRAGYVYGVDISAETIQYAKETYPGKHIEFLEGSVANIPLSDECVDMVVSFETVEHVDEAEQKVFLREVKRVLKPNGFLVISCPNRPIASDLAYELWGYVNEFHKKEHTEKEFRVLLEHYFSCVSFLYQRNENALIMDAPGVKHLQVQWGERKDHLMDVQNLIAVCGEQTTDMSKLACIIPDICGFRLKELQQAADMSKALAAVNELAKNSEAELENTRTKMVNQQAMITSLESQLINQREEAMGLRTQLESQKVKAREEKEQFESQLEEKENVIDERHNTIKEQYKAIEEQSKEIEEQSKEIKEQSKEIKEQSKEIEEQRIELMATKSMLNVIENSTIWRITEPLRKLLDFVKGVIKNK